MSQIPPAEPDSAAGPRRLVPVPGVVDLDALEAPEPLPANGAPPAEPPDASPADAPQLDAERPEADLPGADLPEPPPVVPAAEAPAAADGSRVDLPAPADPPAEAGPADVPTADRPASDVPPAPAASVTASAREATAERGRELTALVLRYGRAHLPTPEPRAPSVDTGPPKLVGRLGQVIPYLKVTPWLLAAAFAVSFAWDFPGQTATVFGREVVLEGLMRMLAVSGLIGYLTNWVAITMLFQPREKRVLIPQGLIPAQRERVIYRLSEAITRELINADIIKQRIQESGIVGRYRDLGLGLVRGVVEDAGFRAELKALAEGYARDVLGSETLRREVAKVAVEKVEQQAGKGLGGVALRLYRTFAEDDFQRRVDRALAELPEAITPLLDRLDAALDSVPGRIEARADDIEDAATKAILSLVEGFDVRATIMEKARGFDEGQLEGLLKSTSNEQLEYIKYLGGLLGVLGGFVIWQPLGALALFVAAGVALWATDEALVRARRARAR